MKQIIKNKLYDTDTAKLIGCDSSRTSDFSRWTEKLYRKRTGEYFIHGEGGPMSRYAVACGNNEWEGGSKIIPLSFEKACEWAEKHLDADQYIKAFGEPTGDDETRQTVSVIFPADIAAKLRNFLFIFFI